MTLTGPRDAVLREALGVRGADTFERALGRAVRTFGGDYADYLAIVTDLREYGRARRLDLREAARELAGQT
jgi:hypothetical protein